jgi:hypothetical protein
MIFKKMILLLTVVLNLFRVTKKITAQNYIHPRQPVCRKYISKFFCKKLRNCFELFYLNLLCGLKCYHHLSYESIVLVQQ